MSHVFFYFFPKKQRWQVDFGLHFFNGATIKKLHFYIFYIFRRKIKQKNKEAKTSIKPITIWHQKIQKIEKLHFTFLHFKNVIS